MQQLDKSLVYKKDRRSPRITHQELSALKVKTKKSHALNPISWIATVGRLVRDIFTIRLGTPKKQCGEYGHVLPASGWQAGFSPRCVECGHCIEDVAELRHSVYRKR